MSVTLYLYNGSATREAWNAESPEFIDDWKPEDRIIHADSVQVTYAIEVKVYRGGLEQSSYQFEDDLLFVDGIYYGDFTVTAEPCRECQNERAAYLDEKKANEQ